MVRNVASFFRELEDEDFYLLSGIEHGMRFSQWVDDSKLPDLSGLSSKEIAYRVKRCKKYHLIEQKIIQYKGYRLRFEGYDALALRSFVERGVIEKFGSIIGVGKESEVYEVQSYKSLALKYHREGYTNFRKVNQNRDYTSKNRHFSWMYTARKAAEKEFEVLETLYPKVSVPHPIDQNRHAILMEMVDGENLSEVRLERDQIIATLSLILGEVSNAIDKGYVHSDLSEYNIFVEEKGVTIFDWPQAVKTSHVNAEELLKRDIENISKYFKRKYPSEIQRMDTKKLVEDILDGEFNQRLDVYFDDA
ncbi:MAG: serine/threonine-protein kinase RIO2 [Halobacteriales archaeon]